jgi:hypothetical protein
LGEQTRGKAAQIRNLRHRWLNGGQAPGNKRASGIYGTVKVLVISA